MIILAPPKQKSVGTLPVVRPTLRGLRIAHLVETNNVEANADMNILSPIQIFDISLYAICHTHSKECG